MTQAETNITPTRKFAVGYFYQEGTYNANVRFLPVVRKYYPYLCEVFFAWPGLASARRSDKKSEIQQKRDILVHDLLECKANGLKLDLLANATCYGDDAVTEDQRKMFYTELETLGKLGLEPGIFTTTSPYLAKIIRNVYPNVERRASVNMKLNSTLGMSYVADYFDPITSAGICSATYRHSICFRNGVKPMVKNSACLSTAHASATVPGRPTMKQ